MSAAGIAAARRVGSAINAMVDDAAGRDVAAEAAWRLRCQAARADRQLAHAGTLAQCVECGATTVGDDSDRLLGRHSHCSFDAVAAQS